MTSVDRSHDKSDSHDKFCWNCHHKCLKISCPNCFRSFHEKCLKSTDAFRWNDKDKSLVSCTVCTVKETSKDACVGMQGHLKMLKHTMVNILNNPDFRVFKDLSALKKVANYCDIVVNPIDLDEIDRKICRELYNSFYAFLVDIDCIYHNCFVYYGERHELTEIAKSLFKFSKLETEAISSCVECYENKHLYPTEWRMMTCNKPHLVLWAKLGRSLTFWPAKKGFTHWPVKLISIIGDELKVVFFESSEFVNISAHDSWIYSTKHATALNQRFYDPNYIYFALKEVNLYGKNVETKFGRFQTDLACIRFDRDHLNDHMAAMFPEYNGTSSISQSQENLHQKSELPNDDDKPIPEKRPRISVHAAQPLIPTLHTSIENDLSGSISDSLVWEHFNVKQIIEEGFKVMNANMMSIIDKNIMNLLNSSKSKLVQAIPTNRHVKDISAYQKKNKELFDKLEAMTSEGDEAKSMLAKAKEGHAAEICTQQAKHEKLAQKLRKVTSERNEARSELAKAIQNRAKETTYEAQYKELAGKLQAITSELALAKKALVKANEKHAKDKGCLMETVKKYETDLIKANHLVNDTIQQSEKTPNNTKFEHDIQMESLKTKLQAEYNESSLKCQKERVVAEIDQFKKDHSAKVAEMENQMQTEKHESIKKVQSSVNLRQNLLKQYNDALTSYRTKHAADLKKQQSQFSIQIANLTKIYSEKEADMEEKAQAAIEAKNRIEKELENKYKNIVAGVKANAELERSQIVQQGLTRCMCCKNLLKVESFCNEKCARMWTSWAKKDSNQTDK
ncbi:uncharacterized protein LOC129571816 [Sitodiplosis mosellana]|uniref:uncharacterized protein LOC129571816 n=1 Tax=Sitodiplosis mosellana TaxID=263140 RepID=UPI002444398E|nr:uncharacterized protein LOC129571816 [Sitodiplosis mosellana]